MTVSTSVAGHRREVDGLRAWAVLPVMAFHASVPGFGGGFVGVDVFFVISGFLITGIIVDDHAAGRFSYRQFYLRRALRILPALFVMIALTLLASSLLTMPGAFAAGARAALAALLFVSNLHFAQAVGYFSASAETIPLLHTWSLSVEEQFYLFHPLLLATTLGHGKIAHARAAIAIVFILSLAVAIIAVGADPKSAFFLTTTRAWELMLGAMGALYVRHAARRTSDLLALAGLAMIVAAVCVYNRDTPFPSLPALLPTLGTLLILLYGSDRGIAGALLANRATVVIGLISYSAYLWHQPLLVFARILNVVPLTPVQGSAVCALALAVGWLSWRYVEMPFRQAASARPTGKPTRRLALGSLTAAALVLCIASGAIVRFQGFPGRFAEHDLQSLASFEKAPSLDPCKLGYTGTTPRSCDYGAPGSPDGLRVALIGDSHASQWGTALGSLLAARGDELHVFAKSACPVAQMPFAYASLGRPYVECPRWRENLMRMLAAERFDVVVISQASVGYFRHNGEDAVRPQDWRRGLDNTVMRIRRAGSRVLVLHDNPQFYDVDPAACFAATRVIGLGSENQCSIPRNMAVEQAARTAERSVAARHGAMVADPAAAMCGRVRCAPFRDGRSMMADISHLSAHGTTTFAPVIVDAIETVAKARR